MWYKRMFTTMGPSTSRPSGRNRQLIGGVLVLSGRFLPLGLLVLGPIVVNILLYHIYIDRKGLEIAVVSSALALFLLCRHWSAYASVFRPFRPASTNPPAGS